MKTACELNAEYLIERRRQLGGFKSWDDVKHVPGFEDKMVENLQAAGLSIGSQRTGTSPSGAGEKREDRTTERSTRPSRARELNSASAEDLQNAAQLDGQRAEYLIEARNRLGGFKSWDEVKREVPSFEDGMVENLQRAGFSL